MKLLSVNLPIHMILKNQKAESQLEHSVQGAISGGVNEPWLDKEVVKVLVDRLGLAEEAVVRFLVELNSVLYTRMVEGKTTSFSFGEIRPTGLSPYWVQRFERAAPIIGWKAAMANPVTMLRVSHGRVITVPQFVPTFSTLKEMSKRQGRLLEELGKESYYDVWCDYLESMAETIYEDYLKIREVEKMPYAEQTTSKKTPEQIHGLDRSGPSKADRFQTVSRERVAACIALSQRPDVEERHSPVDDISGLSWPEPGQDAVAEKSENLF